MIDWILSDTELSVAHFRLKTAMMMSCKRAIKANHHLDNQQAKALLERLAQCQNPFNCPHGRPVTIRFTDTDLEKLLNGFRIITKPIRGILMPIHSRWRTFVWYNEKQQLKSEE